jgi:ADP-heptose:LPS heptosyltransferase
VEILVLHPGALGDIILSLPALSLLRRHYPQAQLTIAGNHDYLNPAAIGCADRTLSLSTIPLHRLYSTEPLSEDDVRFWETYDRIVSWTGAGGPAFKSKLVKVGAKVKVSRWRPDSSEKRHVARIFVESLYPWIPRVESIPPPRIHVDPVRLDEARDWLTEREWTSGENILALHPGAGSVVKRWGIENFRSLAHRYLQQQIGKLLIVEGPAEVGLGRELVRDLTPSCVLLLESAPLFLLAALLSFCCAYVGNDSGISHLAAGLGVPAVTIFGPTSPEQWVPLGERVTILRDSCLSRISPNQIWDALLGWGLC